jgi:hypothetical protein
VELLAIGDWLLVMDVEEPCAYETGADATGREEPNTRPPRIDTNTLSELLEDAEVTLEYDAPLPKCV